MLPHSVKSPFPNPRSVAATPRVARPTTGPKLLPALPLLLILAAGCSSHRDDDLDLDWNLPKTPASQSAQTHFQSPQAAADAFVQALRANDTQRLNQIFGPDSADIVSSGDPVADKAQISKFLAAYDRHHRLAAQADGSTEILVGDDDWPFPVPIAKADNGDGYVFDTAAGDDEILNRRIGRNELTTEQAVLAIADAQQDYAELRPMGGDVPEYAQRLISRPGAKDGLYWPTSPGEQPSPLGELVADATKEGYGAHLRDPNPAPRPYHGYYYRLLTSQGPHAPGGPEDYLVNGRLIGGFGVLAYPVDYGNSGIMSFMTNQDGILYERDLGPDTTRIAEQTTQFDPGPGWKQTKPTTRPALAEEP